MQGFEDAMKQWQKLREKKQKVQRQRDRGPNKWQIMEWFAWTELDLKKKYYYIMLVNIHLA